ncbi:hypothetical protein NQ314_013625 [Rhamnusium bicolor]|uniref:Uncharacterized protein n=1 Tax=Rhamnusium bicolor TaxID=1586634 RepID=A0AAV8X658_9CUCU|nr:hypothetical protein NQ314_013625 [Rhamnusium bicolor]
MTPEDLSRSPTPNFTSTHLTKLSTNRSPQHKNYGPQSLPVIPTSPKSKHVSSIQIPVDSKVMKSEAILQVTDTDHSDTTSEMSDEGYRSLGIVQDKSKQRSSLYSQNSAEDAEENGSSLKTALQVYTEDDLNDFGLRKTQFSQRIYENDIRAKLERNLQSMEKLTEFPNKSPKTQKENSFTKQKENSFTLQKEKSLSRANSTEGSIEVHKSPKRQPTPVKKVESKINTWNGRPKTSRPSLTTETYVSPFARNSTGRRSVSAVNHDRRSTSANTSPTKGRLRQELLQAVKQSEDDAIIAQQVQELLKKYGSLNTLNDEQDFQPSKFTRNTGDRMSYRSPRKDSRPENNLSRIPAPMSYPKA